MGDHLQRGYSPYPSSWSGEARAIALQDDPILLLAGAIRFAAQGIGSLLFAAEGDLATTGTALVAREGVHALERMAERGITSDMVSTALARGTPYWDPKNGSIVYVLEGAFASGRDFAVATNLVGQVTTVMRNFGIVRPRFIPIPLP
jgi:hypothetical protein